MCRVLVRWKEKPRSLKQDWKHESTLSKRGDPIVAMKDGHVWGREEGLPNYVSLDLEGVPKEQFGQFLKPDKSVLVRPDGKPYWMHKHAYNIDLDRLPVAVLDGLRRDGHAAISWAELTGHIIHKRTGLTR
jgi:hypothetical protein